MRTGTLLFLGSLVVGCAGEIAGPGPGGGGDDVQDPACGDGARDSNEQCDDGNTTNGDGCSATCTTEGSVQQGRLDVIADKTTLSSELGKTQTLSLTLTSANGFAGDVTIAPSAVDSAMAALPGVTVTGPSALTLTAGGTSTATYTVKVASNATGTELSGMVKLDVTSTAGNQTIVSTLSIAPVFTVTYANATAATVAMHPIQSGSVTKNITVRRGTRIRYTNADTVRHVTHGSGIFPHENTTTGGTPGATYELSTLAAAPGSTGQLGCHESGHGGSAGYVVFTVE
jgi:cysteine-rich repeat protein